jgi:DNA repair protein SbcC/Rad50
MRPSRLELEGFTAFRDPTVVDFDGADLFALAGPTGSGKTSVLDAMVFALYGTVPRLADQRQVAPVIAQGMAEARVRLDFSVGGDEYTATRIVRRTRSGASTAEARLESGGEVVAGNADEVTAAIVELLGLSFDQFTKCVVLPQGDFARFLHDKPSVRQDLLISLLDLGVYADMAEVARDRASSAKRDVEVLQARLDDVASATPAAIGALADRVAQLTALIAALDAAAPQLATLATDKSATADALARATDELAALREVSVPAGVGDVHERVTEAAATLARTTAAVKAAEELLAEAGDRAELTRWADAYDRVATLTERRAKGQTLVAERRSDVAAAERAVATATTRLDEAKAAVDAAAMANHAHAVREGLSAGDECPVCLQTIAIVPNVKAPPAITKARTALDKVTREHKTAVDAHAAAGQAAAAAAATLDAVETDLAELAAQLEGAPKVAEVKRRLQAHGKATAELGRQRSAHAEATEEHTRLLALEAEARASYDECRDSVAALKPPPRRKSATLLDEWIALGEWAVDQIAARTNAIAELQDKVARIDTEYSSLLAELAQRCADAELDLPRGAEPAAVAREALGRANADHDALVARAAEADRLRKEYGEAEARGALARALATHLDARHFEKWLLDAAMTELADGATELLLSLSAGQYALRVDAKSGNFVVVDHRNADETRGARTLSGGETFLASLALALALADRISTLAARGVARLESIFLDEGFGTLDPDTLDVVASAIEELGASGRMVGVVSHVTELADRLPVRYDVRRSGNAATIERVDR